MPASKNRKFNQSPKQKNVFYYYTLRKIKIPNEILKSSAI